jgi:hypothetical protein
MDGIHGPGAVRIPEEAQKLLDKNLAKIRMKQESA